MTWDQGTFWLDAAILVVLLVWIVCDRCQWYWRKPAEPVKPQPLALAQSGWQIRVDDKLVLEVPAQFIGQHQVLTDIRMRVSKEEVNEFKRCPVPGCALTLAEAQKQHRCRICGQPPQVPVVLNFGKEYACQACLAQHQAEWPQFKEQPCT